MAKFRFGTLVQTFTRVECGIGPAIGAGAARGPHALLVADEAAVPRAAGAVPIGAPRIVLCLGAAAHGGCGNEDAQRKECKFHRSLLFCSATNLARAQPKTVILNTARLSIFFAVCAWSARPVGVRPAAARIGCSAGNRCPGPWHSPCTARS